MKPFLLMLMFIVSFSVCASQDATMYGQLIDEKGLAYGFGQTIIVSKGETKEFTVTGLYNEFYSPMTCKVIVHEPCSSLLQIPKNTPKKSAYIVTSNINGSSSSSQNDFQCSSYEFRQYNGCYYANSGWAWCNNDETNVQDISFAKVFNGSSFKIINRPEFNLKFICTAGGYN